MKTRFDGRINFLNFLTLLALQVESLFPGKGQGEKKKAAIEGMLRTNVDASMAYGTRHALDPNVKKLRGVMVDKAVHNLNWNGLTDATPGQRIRAGLALGYANSNLAAIAQKLDAGKDLTAKDEKAWADFQKSMPTQLVKRPAAKK